MRLSRCGLSAILLTFACHAAIAGGPGAVRKQVESSRLVTGTIDIDAGGRVAGYALEGAGDLPADVHDLFARALPQWRFEPVPLPDGKTIARTKMSVRLVARKVDADSVSVEIRGAQFGEPARGETVALEGRPYRPSYPESALRSGVGGTVYVAVMVGRDGRVVEAMAEQVNLRFIASEPSMRRWREVLANAALRAARQFRFTPPTTGPEVDAPHWPARIPFDFAIDKVVESRATAWEAYVPGPRVDVPWVSGEEREAADAMAGTGAHPIGGGPRLLTPLQPGGT